MKLRRAVAFLAVGVVASLGVTTATQAAPTAGSRGPAYTLVDLGTLGGTFSEAREINARGTVVGDSTTGPGFDAFSAFVGDVHGLIDLGPVDYATLRIFINDRGQVAWSTDTAGSVAAGMYFWDPRTGTRRVGPGTVADINDRGQVAGTDANQAVVWDPGTGRRVLSAPSEGFISVAGINDAGEVAGTQLLPDGTVQALRWDRHGHPQDLGPGTATAINSSGQVAGEVGSCGPASDPCGFLWSPRKGRTEFAAMTVADLNDRGIVVGGDSLGAYVWDVRGGVRHPNIPGALSSSAVAINNRGLVAGRWQDPATDTDKAFVWSERAGFTDLGPFPPQGLPISLAFDVNSRGEVAGVAADRVADEHAAVWVPRSSRYP